VIEDNGVGAVRVNGRVKVIKLALADERRRVRSSSALHHAGHRIRPCGIGERGELVKILLGDARPDPDEDRALPDRGTPGRRER
jgi:hypothetical protein